MREAVGVFLVEAYNIQQLQRLLPPLSGRVMDLMVQIPALGNEVVDRHTGVKAGVGILENHLHTAGKILAETLGGFAADILAVKNNPSLSGIVDADDGAAQSGFATAGLAYQAQGLAPLHRNGDIVHRLDHSAAADAEIFLEIFCLLNHIFWD